MIREAPVAKPSRLAAIGQKPFRWRGWLPVPIIALVAFVAARAADGPRSAREIDWALKVLGLALSIGGESLRFWTLGLVPEGTSGQGYSLEAAALNTQGPYAYVRNPLYLGNLGICAGLLLVANAAWAYAIGLSFFFVQYFFIVRAEENFLRQKYGARFEEYASKVPRWLPRLTPAYPGPLRSEIDWWRAISKEHNPVAAWVSGMMLLLGWQAYRRGALTPGLLAALVSLEGAVLASFAVAKAFKRGWLRRRRD